MLEHVPRPIGKALEGARAGMEKLACNSDELATVPATIVLTSSAFSDGGPMPVRFTADGDKVSPPLRWTGLPPQAVSLALLAEDPDAPSGRPLVHCIVWDLPAHEGGLAEGELKSPKSPGAPHGLGRNSFLKAEYLPPDPPPGHGPHHYVFQLYALDQRLDLDGTPTREDLLKSMRGHVLAKGVLTGVYQRS